VRFAVRRFDLNGCDRKLNIVARPICQDGARDNVEEMIGPQRE
jgi:hypothetical protein